MRSAQGLGRKGRHAAWPAALTPAGFVLPRLFRRPARLIGRLFQGEWTPPRFAASALSAGLVGGAVVYGAFLGGHMPETVKTVTSRTGFAVDAVRVTGNRETSEIDILDRLGFDGWTSLVGFDAAAARDRIAELPWVESAAVRKVYPRGLEVEVVEREAFAIWQNASLLRIVERSGQPITDYAGSGRADLPLVVGAGAAAHASAFLALVAAHPDLAARVKGFIRVGDRRWDLKFDNGLTVKLPEGDEKAALQALAVLERENGILGRDIGSVDLRFADRVVVRLSPEAAEARADALKNKPKKANKTRPKREKRA